ncbi:MAG: DUF4340 domain-containing protein [Planctomycetes bacterium]|nr:DUF4340 domain-containing protein [Planctomycetota bacterium]
MTLKTTIAVVVVGLLAWLAITLLGDPPAPPAPRQPLIEAELLAQWEELELSLLSGSRLRLARVPGGGVEVRFSDNSTVDPSAPADDGTVEPSFTDPADLEQVRALLQALHDSWREPLTGSADDELRAGLVSARMAITVRGGGRALALRYGNDDPTGNGILAAAGNIGADGQETIFRTGKQVPNLLEQNLKQWRDRRVFPQDPQMVTEIEIAVYPPDPDADAEVIRVVRGGGLRDWHIVEPRSLLADGEACAALARQCTALKIDNFISQRFGPRTDEISGLPDRPTCTITLAVGEWNHVVKVGKLIGGDRYTAMCEQRNAQLLFEVAEKSLQPLIDTKLDKLRPTRLFPPLEHIAVSLRCDRPDGQPIWMVERAGQHPKGDWFVQRPFVGRANPARGSNSFGQVIADLDRVAIKEFMPPGTPFTPEARITLMWHQPPVLPTASFEIARDGERVLLRDSKQPDELFVVSGTLGGLIDLDLEICRDLFFLRKDDWGPRIVRWRLHIPEKTIEAVRPELDLNRPFEAGPQTNHADVATLTAEANAVIGAACLRYARRATVLAELEGADREGADRSRHDPFAKIAFELIVNTPDREARLIVGTGADTADGGLWCKLTPLLPDDVWMAVPRSTLERLLKLASR